MVRLSAFAKNGTVGHLKRNRKLIERIERKA